MGKQSKVTIGFRYDMGLLMGISRGPIDEIVEIEAGYKTAWKYDPAAANPPTESDFAALQTWRRSGAAAVTSPTGPAATALTYLNEDKITWPTQITGNQTVTIKAAKLFGGDESEGGVEGTLVVMMGADDQTVNSGLAAMLGGLVPAFRGRVTLFFDGLVCALSKYPKPWAFRVRRTTQGWDGAVWYSAKCAIWLASNTIKSMNPAHIVYESLTNRDWGRGFAAAKLDTASLTACADTFYSEGMGLCLRWARQDSIRNFIQEVLKHCGANLFVSRRTGLWTLRAVRDDYDISELPLFDANSGLLDFLEDDNAAGAVATNEVIVNYTSPIDGKTKSVRVQNNAAIRAAGGIISETLEFPGLPTDEIALRVAQRELRAKVGIKKFKVVLDRRGYQIEPGGVFVVSAPERGIANLVLRAGAIDDGEITDGKITVTAVVDVFGLPANSYIAAQPSLWVPPSVYPEPVIDYVIGEATYRDLAASLTQADFDALTPGTNLVTSIAAAPNGLSKDYLLQIRVGTGNWLSNTGEFAPTGIIAADIPIGAEPIDVTLASGYNLDAVEPGTAAKLNGEIFRVDAIDATDPNDLFVTLARGCIDTVPAAHSAGDTLYFYQNNIGLDKTEYAASVTVDARLLTRSGTGTLSADDADISNYTITQRRDRPYPPGNIQLNSASYPAAIDGQLTVTWSHRDRTLQSDQLIDQSVGSVGPEDGTTYTVKFYGEGDVLLKTVATTGTSYTLDTSDEYASGTVTKSALRDLRVVGLGVVTGGQSTDIATCHNRVEDGYAAMFVSAIAANCSGRFVNTVAVTVTNRTFASGWTTLTQTTGFTLNGTVYQSSTSYDTATGWAVKIGNSAPLDNTPYSILQNYDGLSPHPIRDRRALSTSLLYLVNKEFSVWYWATSYGNRRSIYRDQTILHRVKLAYISTGPMTSDRAVIADYHRANMAQFDDPNNYYDAATPARVNDRLYDGSDSADSYARTAVIFGSLLYVPAVSISASSNTSGRAVNITNALSAHIDIATQLSGITQVYSIDLDGNTSLLATRTGHCLADQVNATTGVEVYLTQVYTVDSSTGAQGSSIISFASNIVPARVVGDPNTETFYVAVRDTSASKGYIYRYDLTGALLATVELPDIQPQVTQNDSLLITSNYVYYGFGNASAGNMHRLNRDLTGLSVINLGDTIGIPGAVSTRVLANYDSPTFIAGNAVLDDSGSSATIPQVDIPRLNADLKIEINSERDGLESHQKHTATTKRKGWGFDWGGPWGGV